eukprot:216141-Pyramimonas_sp.AAC.1
MSTRRLGSRQAERDVWHTHGGMLQGQSVLLGEVRAPVVRNYLHLGSVLDTTGAMMLAIHYRSSTTAGTLRVLRNRVFRLE